MSSANLVIEDGQSYFKCTVCGKLHTYLIKYQECCLGVRMELPIEKELRALQATIHHYEELLSDIRGGFVA